METILNVLRLHDTHCYPVEIGGKIMRKPVRSLSVSEITVHSCTESVSLPPEPDISGVAVRDVVQCSIVPESSCLSNLLRSTRESEQWCCLLSQLAPVELYRDHDQVYPSLGYLAPRPQK